MIHVISSTSDPASRNIIHFIKQKSENKFKTVSCESLLHYKGQKNSKLNIFVSKHESSAGIKSLSCHAPGNFSKAKYGGEDGTLSISNALMQSECLRKLFKLNKDNKWNYKVTLEVTHHGPSLEVPCLFVEIGSGPEQWNHKGTCSGIASVSLSLIKDYKKIMNSTKTIGIGVGGPHYAPNFTRRLLKDKSIAIGHICPKYALKSLNKEMFKQMIDKTVPEPTVLFLDWKGTIKEVRDNVINWCNEFRLEVVKIK